MGFTRSGTQEVGVLDAECVDMCSWRTHDAVLLGRLLCSLLRSHSSGFLAFADLAIQKGHSNFEKYSAIIAADISSALFYLSSLPGTPIVHMLSLVYCPTGS